MLKNSVPQVGGHVIAHASTVRLSLRKGKAEQRIMKVRMRGDAASYCMRLVSEVVQHRCWHSCVYVGVSRLYMAGGRRTQSG